MSLTIQPKTSQLGAGNTVYLGQTRPGGGGGGGASGTLANVSTNTISSVYPSSAPDTRTRGSTAILDAWSGSIYAATYGANGSIIVSGGGHGDYLGNEVYRYDIATRVWTRIAEPYDIPVSYAIGTQSNDPHDNDGLGIQGTGVADLTYGEYWTDDTKTATVVGQMCPTHTYGQNLWVPGSAVGNTNGWMVIVGNFNKQCHKIDLDNPAAGWSRLGPLLSTTGKPESPGYGASTFDPVRNHIICWPFTNGGQDYAYAIAVPSGAVSVISSNYVDSYGCIANYSPADDCFILCSSGTQIVNSGRPKIFVHDAATNARYDPISTGALPPAGAGTVEWAASSRQLVYWPGTGNLLYIGQAPANPRTGTWVWTTQTFTGATPDRGGDVNPLYRRLHWVPQLNSFFHVGGTTSLVQRWQL